MTGQEIQKSDSTASLNKRRPICGKCGSLSVYLERDPFNGVQSIACRICGNRYPGGLAPVLKYGALEALKALSKGPTFVKNADGTITTWSPPSAKAVLNQLEREQQPKDNRRRYFTISGGKEMEEKTTKCGVGHCKNCKRDGVKIQTQMGMCHQCIAYTTGTKGEARVNRLKEAAHLYGKLKPGERIPYGAAVSKKHGAAFPVRKPSSTEKETSPLEIEANQLLADKAPESRPAAVAPNQTLSARKKYVARLDLCFYEADRPLYDLILSSARRDRRTPGQQILFLLGLAIEDRKPQSNT